jgi:ABC-type polysaccharide/polyol phosphate transport system ATPase subunit
LGLQADGARSGGDPLSAAALAPGEIVLEGASRSFALAHERPRTLKELFVTRGRRRRSIQALDEVTLRVAPGEAVGIVGRNGAGKTSTLRCLAGIVPLDSGRADCGGRVASLLELGAGFGEDFTGRENVLLNGALHGFTRPEIEARMDSIVAFSELGDFVDVPVKAYSSGMFLRLGFAIVAHLDADVLLIDEILAVGDESFRRKCLALISERMAAGATLVFVSHDPTSIERICERLVVLDHGKVAFDGPVAQGLLHYHRMLGTGEERSRTLRPEQRRAGASILELELRDSGGAPRHVFRPGEPLRAELLLAAEQQVDRAVVAIEVRSSRGELCFRTDRALGDLRGERRARFEVERLALLGGDYDLAAGVFGQDAPAGRLLDRVVGFSVAATSDGEGIADLRGRWELAGDRAAAEALR